MPGSAGSREQQQQQHERRQQQHWQGQYSTRLPETTGPCPDSALPPLPACLPGSPPVPLPQKWVRKRMAQGGLPRPSAVHIVSSTKQRGVRELLADLQSAVGLRGDVWVVGAQVCSEACFCFWAPPAAVCLACLQHHMPAAATSHTRNESQARNGMPPLLALAAHAVPALALPPCLRLLLPRPACRMRARAL
jgi:hypothetical protein